MSKFYTIVIVVSVVVMLAVVALQLLEMQRYNLLSKADAGNTTPVAVAKAPAKAEPAK